MIVLYICESVLTRIEKLRGIIAALQPGQYKLSQLCGDDWLLMDDYNSFSCQFKRVIESGMLPNVSVHPKKGSNDTTVYTVHPPSR